ncbi:unannotated protein [freshwater metagenome]|uniref:histidine kinase n=1 Tax=freshwater metagenome TaxID=449393 RepID=A0A6J6RK46_9ZZZZ
MRRRVGQPDWSDEEAEAARAIGQDLGDAVLTARSYLRQQELGDYKGRLITAVSHELRQPISAMLGHLAVLAETVDELDPDDPTYAPLSSTTRRIGRAAERLSGIVTDLLSLSLVEGEESATPRTPVDLGEVVHGAVELLSIRALHGQVTLTESSNADVSVLGDAAELERLMINLVGNAVKYTAAGGTVAVSCTAEGDEAIVTITDTGIGISADDLAHLFEEFYRANDVEARRREGTGLGLAIVARIVERHHGRISAASIHGEGSTFTVTLPLAPPG